MFTEKRECADEAIGVASYYVCDESHDGRAILHPRNSVMPSSQQGAGRRSDARQFVGKANT